MQFSFGLTSLSIHVHILINRSLYSLHHIHNDNLFLAESLWIHYEQRHVRTIQKTTLRTWTMNTWSYLCHCLDDGLFRKDLTMILV